jgi:hypothetical protein
LIPLHCSSKFQLTEPQPFPTTAFDALDAEIRSVFPPGEIISPDNVRGHKTH